MIVWLPNANLRAPKFLARLSGPRVIGDESELAKPLIDGVDQRFRTLDGNVPVGRLNLSNNLTK
jgi:hypothetical protein